MLLPSPSSMRAAANTPAGPAGALVAHFPASASLPQRTGGSAPGIPGFEACSAFTRVAARMVAGSPKATRSTEVLRTMSLPPSSAPIATAGATVCRAGLHPLRDDQPTAHVDVGSPRLRLRVTPNDSGLSHSGPQSARLIVRFQPNRRSEPGCRIPGTGLSSYDQRTDAAAGPCAIWAAAWYLTDARQAVLQGAHPSPTSRPFTPPTDIEPVRLASSLTNPCMLMLPAAGCQWAGPPYRPSSSARSLQPQALFLRPHSGSSPLTEPLRHR